MCTPPIFQHGFWRWTEPGITNWTSEHHSFGYVVALMLWHSVGLAVGNIVASGLLQQVWHFLWRQMESWRGLPDYPTPWDLSWETRIISKKHGVDSFLISFFSSKDSFELGFACDSTSVSFHRFWSLTEIGRVGSCIIYINMLWWSSDTRDASWLWNSSGSCCVRCICCNCLLHLG